MKNYGPAFRQAGFTLVELIVVFSIMAIIMAIAIPSFNAFNQGQTLKNAAAELKSNLSAGQTRAISGVKTCQNGDLAGYEAQFFLDATSYTVVEKCTISPDGNIQTYGLPSLGNVRIAQGSPVTFKPLNQGTDLINTLVIKLVNDSGGSACVQVTPTGEISQLNVCP